MQSIRAVKSQINASLDNFLKYTDMPFSINKKCIIIECKVYYLVFSCQKEPPGINLWDLFVKNRV